MVITVKMEKVPSVVVFLKMKYLMSNQSRSSYVFGTFMLELRMVVLTILKKLGKIPEKRKKSRTTEEIRK